VAYIDKRTGYRKIRVDGRHREEHRLVWERAYGPIPPGYHIHHRNGDKLDNRLENPELLDPLTHGRLQRLNAGWHLSKKGIWKKRCRWCRRWKPVDEEHWCFNLQRDDSGRLFPGDYCSSCGDKSEVVQKMEALTTLWVLLKLREHDQERRTRCSGF